MVDPTALTRDLRPASPGCAPWMSATPACFLIALLLMAAGIMGWCGPARGADKAPAPLTLPPGSSLTFDEAVKIALIQCPNFTKSSLDIDIRRMDETDSRYGMVPPLTFRTVYYVNRPSGAGGSKPYSLSFTTDPYNPIGAYFTLQAQKLVSQMAVLTHLQLISKGLEHLGSFFLELDALQKMAACQRELVQVAREDLNYVENRMSIGTSTSLEVKVAQQQLALALGEQEGIALSTKQILVNLRNFLGLPSTQDVTPNFRDSRRQVLGSFDPATATLDQAKQHSYELRSFDLYKQLQTYNIRLAKSKVLPTFFFNTQTPSPLSVSTGQGLYVGLGVEIPVWDGFKRIRNVSRQKAMMRQIDARKLEKEDVIESQLLSVQGDIQAKGVTLKNAQTLENLARLKAQQNDVRYQSGEAPLTTALESRKEVLKFRKDALRQGLAYDKAILQLRENSGDLGHTYVDEKSWQK